MTWDVMVIPKRGEIFRQRFAVRPGVTMEVYDLAVSRLVVFRLHLTAMGLAYVETDEKPRR